MHYTTHITFSELAYVNKRKDKFFISFKSIIKMGRFFLYSGHTKYEKRHHMLYVLLLYNQQSFVLRVLR